MTFSPLTFFRTGALTLTVAALALVAMGASSVRAQSGFEDPGAATSGGGGGDLVAVESRVDAGEVALGSSSQIVMLFRNDAVKPLNLGELNLYPSSNVSAVVSQNQCSGEPLAPQAVCAVAFSVKGLQSGRFRIEILARHDGRSRLLTASINGNVDVSGNTAGQRNNDLEMLPEKIEFSKLDASRPQVRSVLIRNITSQPIDIQDVILQSNDLSGFSLDQNCSELQSGGACVISVTWAPQQIGQATGTILVKHSGPTGASYISLEGIYEPKDTKEAAIFSEAVPGKGLLVSSLREINFGTGIEKVSSITVSLVNTGDAPLTLNDIALSNTENGLQVDKTGCVKGRVLEPIEACPLTLTWSPVRAGGILDDVRVQHSGARGILVLPVRGTASQAVSKDSQAIVLGDFAGIPAISSSEVEGGSGGVGDIKMRDVRGVLDGYRITSLATGRAIVNGPGGSRVVMHGENTVIGGVPWVVSIKQGAVQFTHGDQTIVLLFDRSLSLINQDRSQSGSSTSGSSGPGSVQ